MQIIIILGVFGWFKGMVLPRIIFGIIWIILRVCPILLMGIGFRLLQFWQLLECLSLDNKHFGLLDWDLFWLPPSYRM
ncbi:MAG: hypothetical protein WCK35_09875 [Chloroflexota bacterium]